VVAARSGSCFVEVAGPLTTYDGRGNRPVAPEPLASDAASCIEIVAGAVLVRVHPGRTRARLRRSFADEVSVSSGMLIPPGPDRNIAAHLIGTAARQPVNRSEKRSTSELHQARVRDRIMKVS
jgi:hypothetical protein